MKQRIAGKSLPMEKFAVKKAQRFLAQGNHLALPALELIYIWNNFRILGQQYKLVEPMFVLIEQTMKRLEQHKGNIPLMLWLRTAKTDFDFSFQILFRSMMTTIVS